MDPVKIHSYGKRGTLATQKGGIETGMFMQKILGSMSECAWKEGRKDLPIQHYKNRGNALKFTLQP